MGDTLGRGGAQRRRLNKRGGAEKPELRPEGLTSMGSLAGRKNLEEEKNSVFTWEVKANDRAYNDQFKEKIFLCLWRKKYKDNIIHTAKYNFFSFLPLNLYEQFHCMSNLYFLLIIILQGIPEISTLPWFTLFIPLVSLLVIRATRDLVDDIGRHRSDKTINNRPCRMLVGKSFLWRKWKNLCVGDLVCLHRDNIVPADMLLLASTEPSSLCYVETADIDGETNLKFRQAPMVTHHELTNVRKMASFQGKVVCEEPNSRMHHFVGCLEWDGKKYPLDSGHILLRGCKIRNTDTCYGMVLYAGFDTKIMRSCGGIRLKRTKTDRLLNRLVILIFLTLMLLSSILTLFFWYTMPELKGKHHYTGEKHVHSLATETILIFWAFLILFSVMVPMAMFVLAEFIYLGNSIFINWDVQMYYEPRDRPAKARNTSLADQLGQVEYIFSDKTGTLTENIMTFKKCCIDGIIYGGDRPQRVPSPWGHTARTGHRIGAAEPQSRSAAAEGGVRCESRPAIPKAEARVLRCPGHRVWAWLFLVAPGGVTLGRGGRGTPSGPGELSLKQRLSPGPDEEEVPRQENPYIWNKFADGKLLFRNLKLMGAVLDRKDRMVQEFWRLLAICHTVMAQEKDSERPDKLVYQAASPDEEALVTAARNFGYVFLARTQDSITSFAQETLRTLCLAYKKVDEDAYKDWHQRHQEASILLQNRAHALHQLYEEMEQNLQLLGATAIEDRLQDGVPETIQCLKQGNIKVWVLTGDKQETAVNIGFACRLLSEDMLILEEKEIVRILEAYGESNNNLLGDKDSLKNLFLPQVKTAMPLYEGWFLALYNLLYTTLPVLYIGLFEQDLSAKQSLELPELYVHGQQDRLFNYWVFLQAVAHGMATSLVNFFVTLWVSRDTAGPLSFSDYQSFAEVVALSCLLSITVEVILIIKYWTVLCVLAISLSLCLYMVITWASQSFWLFRASPFAFAFLYANRNVVSQPSALLVVLLNVSLNTLPVLAFRIIYQALKKPHPKAEAEAEIPSQEIITVDTQPYLHRGSRSRRSSYAFSHREGYADLITQGTILRRSPAVNSDILADHTFLPDEELVLNITKSPWYRRRMSFLGRTLRLQEKVSSEEVPSTSTASSSLTMEGKTSGTESTTPSTNVPSTSSLEKPSAKQVPPYSPEGLPPTTERPPSPRESQALPSYQSSLENRPAFLEEKKSFWKMSLLSWKSWQKESHSFEGGTAPPPNETQTACAASRREPGTAFVPVIFREPASIPGGEEVLLEDVVAVLEKLAKGVPLLRGGDGAASQRDTDSLPEQSGVTHMPAGDGGGALSHPGAASAWRAPK
ncbi:phospholipid-transporting ATPase IK [Pteropus vampyrus]|uniref:Phospholipid-transporting ATPase IK n=1 Tax=Pteropus vampyrus TaxID=132908 RepID=A0A6P6D2U7_PTEVA|nr:phospholipid-transporting ATPase IK [Pteropus vampyrus]